MTTGILELLCAIIQAIPHTAVLGASSARAIWVPQSRPTYAQALPARAPTARGWCRCAVLSRRRDRALRAQ